MPGRNLLARAELIDMATRQETVDYIVEQATGALVVTAKKMFGEYALYADDKLVALICDDQLFIKPTSDGRSFIGEVDEVPPYKGAKPSFLISGDQLEDADWLADLVRRTADALPTRPPKKRRSKARGPAAGG